MSKTDYDLTKIKAVAFDVDGVLSPATVPMDDNGVPRRQANLRDGYAIQLAVRQGLRIAIITGANDEAVRKRYAMLGVSEIYMLKGPKLPVLKQWMATHDLSAMNVAYVGDDIPDYECMKTVGLPVAPADAAQELKAVARYVTTAAGGYGVARELLEQILKAQGLWPLTSDAFGK